MVMLRSFLSNRRQFVKVWRWSQAFRSEMGMMDVRVVETHNSVSRVDASIFVIFFFSFKILGFKFHPKMKIVSHVNMGMQYGAAKFHENNFHS